MAGIEDSPINTRLFMQLKWIRYWSNYLCNGLYTNVQYLHECTIHYTIIWCTCTKIKSVVKSTLYLLHQ